MIGVWAVVRTFRTFTENKNFVESTTKQMSNYDKMGFLGMTFRCTLFCRVLWCFTCKMYEGERNAAEKKIPKAREPKRGGGGGGRVPIFFRDEGILALAFIVFANNKTATEENG